MTVDFAVLAELPLGAYRGRLADGAVDPVPAPARLHGALLQAAAQGTRAVKDGSRLVPRDDDLAALHWLEQNPPDGVHLPPTRTTRSVSHDSQIVYRVEGTLKKEGRSPGPQDKKVGKLFAGVVAVNGPFAWTWSAPPPAEVQQSLGHLVGDVSHLGTSESPARMYLGQAEPTHRLAADASYLEPAFDALDLDVALPGRTDELQEIYEAELAPPKPAADRFSSSEEPRSRPGWHAFRGVSRYLPVDEVTAVPGPWVTVLHAALDADVPVNERVATAVGAHRSLIRVIGEGAPAVLTGSYPAGALRPANRVSLQILPARDAALAGLPIDTPHLLALLPRGIDPADQATVEWAFRRIHRAGRYTVLTRGRRDAATFWASPAGDASRRIWSTEPVAVPETRVPKGGEWTLQHSVALSVGHLVRDLPASVVEIPEFTGPTRYRDLAEHLIGAGVQVLRGDFLHTGNVDWYVHKAPERGVVRPYTALLTLGAWSNPRWITAIGQSRHLGGGLLVPVDIPPSVRGSA